MDPKNPYQPPSADVSPQLEKGVDQTSPISPAGRFGRLSFIAWGAILGEEKVAQVSAFVHAKANGK